MWPEGAQSIKEVTKRPLSVSNRFKQSMIEMVQNLSTKNPFYVRCIKPNEAKSPEAFDYEKVKNQVFYLGLLENVRVRRAGFAYRLTYEKFLQRYKCLSRQTWPNPRHGSCKDNVNLILREFSYDNDVRNGLTKVFIKSPQTVFALETKRNDKMPAIVNFLQKHWRGTLARMYYKRLRAAYRIAGYYKKFKARQYITCLCKTYAGARQRSDFGRGLKWPGTRGGSFKEVDVLMKKMYTRWRCFMVLRPYPASIRTEMYLLSIFCELTKGRKISSSLVQRWKGDYLSDGVENPRNQAYLARIASLKGVDGFGRVLFSSFVEKMSQQVKTQRRAIVVTDKCMYRLDEDFGVSKGPVKLSEVVRACISNEADNQVVVISFRNQESDWVFYLEMKSREVFDRVPEILANIYRVQIK